MATTFKSDNFWVPMPTCPGVGIALFRDFTFTFAAAFVINDVVQLFKFPAKGAPICFDAFFIDVPDLDSSGSPAVTLALGDEDTVTQFVLQSAHTVGQSAGFLASEGAVANGGAALGSMPVIYTSDKTLALKVIAAPTTGVASGVIKGWAMYHYIGAPSTVDSRP